MVVNDHVSFLQVVCLALVLGGETTISDPASNEKGKFIAASDGYVMLALSIISCAITAWFFNFCSYISAVKSFSQFLMYSI